jgi:hypothetical protein
MKTIKQSAIFWKEVLENVVGLKLSFAQGNIPVEYWGELVHTLKKSRGVP